MKRKPAKSNVTLSTRADLDTIQHYLVAGTDLKISAKLNEQLQRLLTTADLLRKHGSQLKVAGILRNLYGYALSTAYVDIADAQEVFAPQQMHDRGFYVDVVLDKMFTTHRMAVEKQDLKTAAATEKNIMFAIIKFMGTAEAFPLDQVQAPRLTLGSFPELVGRGLKPGWESQLKKILAGSDVGEAEVMTSDEERA